MNIDKELRRMEKSILNERIRFSLHPLSYRYGFLRSFKDTVFKQLFSEPENALGFWKDQHPESDATEKDIRILNSRAAFIDGIISDVTFSVKGQVVVILEAQSSWNPNLAARCMFYAAAELYRHLSSRGGTGALHQSRMLRFPYPEIYLVYCGPNPENIPNVVRFSDSYQVKTEKPLIECTVPVLKAPEVTGTMKGYVDFCLKFYENLKCGKAREEAAAAAIDWCIAEEIFPEYFQTHRMEVVGTMLSYSDIADIWDSHADEAESKGKAEEQLRCIRGYHKEGVSIPTIAKVHGLSEDEVRRILGIEQTEDR